MGGSQMSLLVVFVFVWLNSLSVIQKLPVSWVDTINIEIWLECQNAIAKALIDDSYPELLTSPY